MKKENRTLTVEQLIKLLSALENQDAPVFLANAKNQVKRTTTQPYLIKDDNGFEKCFIDYDEGYLSEL